MFSGNYLENEDNIGHEIINLYKDDNGKNYIYLLSGGDYQKDRADNDIQGILLVRGISANCVEVIAKATGTIEKVFNPTDNDIIKENGKTKSHWKNGWSGATVKEMRAMGNAYTYICAKHNDKNSIIDECKTQKIILKKKIKKEGMPTKYEPYEKEVGNKILRFKDIHEKQIEYIEKNNIMYDDIPLDKLYANNNTEYGLSIYITYKAETVKKVKKPFYLYINGDSKRTENDVKLNRNRLSGSAGATFYPKDDKNDSDYKKLQEILDSSDLWGEDTKRYKDIEKVDADDFTFLSLIKKEYDELSFSNMFAYYFKKNENILKAILSKTTQYTDVQISQPCLKTKVEIHNSNTSQTEDIENNIASKDTVKRIAREEKNIDILIDDVQSGTVIVIENKIKSELNGRHSTDSILNQLDKYFDYTEKEYTSYKNKVYLLLVPDYSRITKESLKSEKQQKFDIIHYSDLCDILNQNKTEDKYFDDFVKAVHFHSTSVDNHFEDIMKRKMQKLINEAKK